MTVLSSKRNIRRRPLPASGALSVMVKMLEKCGSVATGPPCRLQPRVSEPIVLDQGSLRQPISAANSSQCVTRASVRTAPSRVTGVTSREMRWNSSRLGPLAVPPERAAPQQVRQQTRC